MRCMSSQIDLKFSSMYFLCQLMKSSYSFRINSISQFWRRTIDYLVFDYYLKRPISFSSSRLLIKRGLLLRGDRERGRQSQEGESLLLLPLSAFNLQAQASVFRVDQQHYELGDIFPIIKDLQFPVKQSLRAMVSLLHRKGVCCLPRSMALMHYLRASRLLLIYELANLSRLEWSLPLSEPAKSTKTILPLAFPLLRTSRFKMACDLDERPTLMAFWEDTRKDSPKFIIQRS